MFDNLLKQDVLFMIFLGDDLNRVFRICDPAMRPIVESHHAHRQARFRAGDGTPATQHLSSVRRSLRRASQGQALLLPGSISVPGLRAAYLPESLRDIQACLRAQSSKLYHLGIRGKVARNTLANANATRDWRIYCDFAQSLIGTARWLYADEPFGLDLKDTV